MKTISLVILLCLSLCAKAQNSIVKIAKGKIQGTINADKTVRIFKGIPFTAPPVENYGSNWTKI